MPSRASEVGSGTTDGVTLTVAVPAAIRLSSTRPGPGIVLSKPARAAAGGGGVVPPGAPAVNWKVPTRTESGLPPENGTAGQIFKSSRKAVGGVMLFDAREKGGMLPVISEVLTTRALPLLQVTATPRL